MKSFLENVKVNIISNKYGLTYHEKQRLIAFIEDSSKNNSKIRSLNRLTLNLNKVDANLKNKTNEIKFLNNKVDNYKNENMRLKVKNYQLEEVINHLRYKWNNFIKYLNKSLFNKTLEEQDNYIEKFYDELIEEKVIDNIDIKNIEDKYEKEF